MNMQNSLSDESHSPDSPESSGSRASGALVISAPQLAPEQKLFNQWLEKIEKCKTALQNLRFLADSHRVQAAKRLGPFALQQQLLKKQMALFLDQRLQDPKGLSKAVRAYLAHMIYGLAAELVNMPDCEEMAVLYKRYAGSSARDRQADLSAEAAAMQAMMSNAFGLDLGDGETLDSPEQVLAAAMRKIQEQREQQASAQAAKMAKRKKTSKQLAAELESIDADKVLRDIYRKLASALHPDREPDEKERQRKTALMVQVNVANEKRDLLALLQLQLLVEQIDPKAVSAMADDKLRHFNRVLKQQAASLQSEIDQELLMFRSEFELPFGAITPRSLELALRHQVREHEEVMAQMKEDIDQIQDDRGLKRWIKMQKALSEDDGDDFDELDLMAMMATKVVRR